MRNTKPKVYIDGQEGTTGLRIRERLLPREDIMLLEIDPDKRKDEAERKRLINEANLVFLCLPDKAAVEAVGLINEGNLHTKVIDASTAHRVSEGWVYGLPELSKAQRQSVQSARLLANPGCHATGFITAVAPLIAAGIVPQDYPFSAFSLTGYSGGGKKMIAEYEAADCPELYQAPRLYGLTQTHKHLPEMKMYAGLSEAPVFCPIVDDYYSGMAVTVSLEKRLIEKAGKKISKGLVRETLLAHYEESKLISVSRSDTEGMLSAGLLAGSDKLEIFVNGTDERITVTSVFDNLGKGASGAAVQNMNLMLGYPETEGLEL
ncbi:MAG: N-acetyl-gamma-glutamyl-phosphate reductase [Eubacteriales bacterium]|nr:N-acetyl-gamma-glutamyl-phosphate reductase [Eubacteriales bacterium]